MYHEFFGLNEPAFSIAVNPRYLYMSDQHREALAHLLYGIRNGGFVMLTGEVGTGKTTIIRCLLEQLPDNTDMAIILNPMASAPELLSTICEELGASYIDDTAGIKELTDALQHFLLQNHRKGRRTVLLIDEAQLLKVPVLEQIRLLTNLETTTEKLLQIVLVGQPELKRLLARPALRQLSQRITARFHLEALSLPEAQAYISHRLKVAGLPEHKSPFSLGMIKKIHQFSGGIPRLINILCERLLLGAYAKHSQHIDSDIFRQAVLEVSGTNSQQEEKTHKLRGTYHAVFIAALLMVMVAVWYFVPDELVRSQAQPKVMAQVASSASSMLASSSVPAEKILAAGSLVAPVTAVSSLGKRDLVAAQLGLIDYLGIDAHNEKNPCAAQKGVGFACEKTRVASWDELKDINRPSLLTLTTVDKKWVYVLAIGLDEHQVMIWDKGARHILPWAQIAELWTGDVLYIWSRPADFEKELQLGDKGPLVTWVAEQFAQLDQQSTPLTRQFFTDKLKKRVELFQSSQNIFPDGIIGSQTLRRLNEVFGVDKVLVDIPSQEPAGQVAPQASAVKEKVAGKESVVIKDKVSN